MNTFETSAFVEAEGQVLVKGVPFEAGTQVEVTITPVASSNLAGEAAARTARLLAALDNARNSEAIGPLRRAELYDRDILR